MQEKILPPYFDYQIALDPDAEIVFNVDDEVVIDSNTSIKILYKAKEEIPKRTQFRFIIPYAWEPINLETGICSIKSSVKGKVKGANSQIMVQYILNEPLGPGGTIEFDYNESKERNVSGDIAFIDPVQCALDIKLPGDKQFTRIGIKEVKMVADKAKFFLVKVPTLYNGNPVDIEIVALDKFGNRDYNFNGDVEIVAEKCLNAPNTAMIEDGILRIEKSLSFIGDICPDTEIVKLLKDDSGFGDYPVFQELTKNIGKIKVKCGKIEGISNPIVRDRDFSNQLYWGDTHIHTREYSDGMGTGNDGFNYAKNYSLHDFAALGDHLNQRFNYWMEGRKMIQYAYDSDEWLKLVDLCKAYTDASFIAIPAYEWSGRVLYAKAMLQQDCPYDAISDKVILFPLEGAENAPLVDYSSVEGCFQDQLYAALKDVECAVISHTPISESMGTSWSEVDSKIEKVVEIYSQHGSSEEFGGGYRTLRTNRRNGSVRWALKNGFKLGFIGGGDDHYAHPGCPINQSKMKNLAPVLRFRPGIAAIFSKELNSRSILKNLNERNCYATTGERMWIKIKTNSTLMGKETAAEEPPVIFITVCGTSRVESVELIKNGSVIAIRTPAYDRIKFAYKDDNLKSGEEAFYYVRLTQFDGERGWSSPIWVKLK